VTSVAFGLPKSISPLSETSLLSQISLKPTGMKVEIPSNLETLCNVYLDSDPFSNSLFLFLATYYLLLTAFCLLLTHHSLRN